MERLPKHTRQERILRRLSSDVAVRISALADEFAVTTETVRRDLDELSERGLLSRTYGGAAIRSVAGEPGVYLRAQERVEERRRIAQAAAEEVRPGDVLMIDAGSTTAHFASALVQRSIELTVITNSLTVARRLGGADSVTVLMCPGEFRVTEEGVFGFEVANFLNRFHADLAVIGAGGISDTEVTDADPEGVEVKRRMMARSARTMLLADAGKFGRTLFATVCLIPEIDVLVTDSGLTGEQTRMWRSVRVASGSGVVA